VTPEPPRAEAVDATRRTRLATERTELAWWRTGLTALAVALAVGRVVPGIGTVSARWPYVTVGICFAVYGIAVIAYGTARSRAVERDLEEGRFPKPPHLVHGTIALGGVVLGVLTAILIAVD
jgi:putative membrane protein